MEYYSTIKSKEIMAFAATRMDLEIIMLSEVRQWDANIKCYHLHVESKKRHNEFLCRTDTDSQTEKLNFQMRQVGGWWDALRVWDGSAIKFGCDDHCTTINVIKIHWVIKKRNRAFWGQIMIKLKWALLNTIKKKKKKKRNWLVGKEKTMSRMTPKSCSLGTWEQSGLYWDED